MIKKNILEIIKKEVVSHYHDNLVSLCLFGSVAKGTATSSSDVDLLIICRKLKLERLRRVKDFAKIENNMVKKGHDLLFSPLIKTEAEIMKGSPLFFDMIDRSIILYDRGNFFKNYLSGLQKRLEALGARRIERGDYWFWILKQDYKLGEVFSI